MPVSSNVDESKPRVLGLVSNIYHVILCYEQDDVRSLRFGRAAVAHAVKATVGKTCKRRAEAARSAPLHGGANSGASRPRGARKPRPA